MKRYFLLLLPAAMSLLASPLLAQNTAGVFPPMVNEGHSSLQYRAANDLDRHGFVQRLHYQRAVNGDFMWRVVGQSRKTPNKDVDFDFFQAELFWDLSENTESWRTGFRFDVRVRDRGRPGQLGVHWTNQVQLNANTRARFLVMTAVDIGDGAPSGVLLQTRGDVARSLPSGVEIGLELYNTWGYSSDFGDFDDQLHEFGPMVTVPFGDGWSVLGSVLFGLSDRAPDQDLRFWLTKSF